MQPDVIGVGLLFGIFILGVGVGLFGAHLISIVDLRSNIFSIVLFINAVFLLLILIALAGVRNGIFSF